MQNRTNSVEITLEVPRWLSNAIVPAIAVHGSSCHVAIILCHARFRVVVLLDNREAILRPLRMCRREEIDNEAPYIDDVYQRDDPLKDGAHIVVFPVLLNAKADSKTNFDKDESKLDPEASAEDAVFAEVNAETLVFCADEYR